MFKVKVYGAKEYWTQVPRLIQGFIGNDCLISTDDDYDFVYSNNFNYEDIDSEHDDSAISNSGFKIFNVLDIPEHLEAHPVEKMREQLKEAQIVTCISEPVKEQLKRILNIDAPIIWNPIKDVFYDSLQEREINCLYVGRATDPIKRASLLSKIENQCYSVGPTHGVGNYLGLVNDISLNQIYNSSKIVALPSRFEGLGLTALEAMVCGAIPLVCGDNPNSLLCPDFCVCEPSEDAVEQKYRELLNNFEEYQSIILTQYAPKIALKFSKFSVAKNILDLYSKADK
tara:strand:- start:8779 stop:9633 length:855 start_codon:yes stop_codon:yes gene_type:complete